MREETPQVMEEISEFSQSPTPSTLLSSTTSENTPCRIKDSTFSGMLDEIEKSKSTTYSPSLTISTSLQTPNRIPILSKRPGAPTKLLKNNKEYIKLKEKSKNTSKKGSWSREEDEELKKLYNKYENIKQKWVRIGAKHSTRNKKQCKSHYQKAKRMSRSLGRETIIEGVMQSEEFVFLLDCFTHGSKTSNTISKCIPTGRRCHTKDKTEDKTLGKRKQTMGELIFTQNMGCKIKKEEFGRVVQFIIDTTLSNTQEIHQVDADISDYVRDSASAEGKVNYLEEFPTCSQSLEGQNYIIHRSMLEGEPSANLNIDILSSSPKSVEDFSGITSPINFNRDEHPESPMLESLNQLDSPRVQVTSLNSLDPIGLDNPNLKGIWRS